MGVRIYKLKGRAKTWVAIAVFAYLAWTLFGTGFFNFNLSFFNRGFQVASLRGGHFQRGGSHWQQHNVIAGRVVSLGGETTTVDVGVKVNRGMVVLHAWAWPSFLYDEPTVFRLRMEQDTKRRLEIPLDSAGIYVLSVNGIHFGGDLSLDWRTGG